MDHRETRTNWARRRSYVGTLPPPRLANAARPSKTCWKPHGCCRASRIARPSPPRAPSTTALGGAVFLKCENLQRMGAFKFRGAYNAMSRLTPTSGAAACSPTRRATTPRPSRWPAACSASQATVVMPKTAPADQAPRDRGLRGGGRRVRPGDAGPRGGRALRCAATSDPVLIPPFDHPRRHRRARARRPGAVRRGRAARRPARALRRRRAAVRVGARGARAVAALPRHRRRAGGGRRRHALVPHGHAADGAQPATPSPTARARRRWATLTFPLVRAQRRRHGHGHRRRADRRDALRLGAHEARGRADRCARPRGGPERRHATSPARASA